MIIDSREVTACVTVKMTTESTSFIQFDYCDLCKISHRKQKKHLYSKRHQEIIGNILKKFSKKIKEAKKCLNTPVIEALGWESGAQFWCYYCKAEVFKHKTEVDATVKYGGIIQHIASDDHSKRTGEFFYKNIIDKSKKAAFVLTEAEGERFSNKSETALTLYRQKMNASIKEVADKIRSQNMQQERVVGSSKERAPPWAQTCTKQTQITHHAPVSHVTSPPDANQPELTRRTVVRAVAPGLTSVSAQPNQSDESVGNVFTGATPPWLIEDQSNKSGGEIGPTISEYEKHLERERKKKLPANRVGAKFDHSTPTSSSWLPSFGGVWNQGRRLGGKHQYDKRKGSFESVRSSIPSTIVPYQRKNRSLMVSAHTGLISSPLVDSHVSTPTYNPSMQGLISTPMLDYDRSTIAHTFPSVSGVPLPNQALSCTNAQTSQTSIQPMDHVSGFTSYDAGDYDTLADRPLEFHHQMPRNPHRVPSQTFSRDNMSQQDELLTVCSDSDHGDQQPETCETNMSAQRDRPHGRDTSQLSSSEELQDMSAQRDRRKVGDTSTCEEPQKADFAHHPVTNENLSSNTNKETSNGPVKLPTEKRTINSETFTVVPYKRKKKDKSESSKTDICQLSTSVSKVSDKPIVTQSEEPIEKLDKTDSVINSKPSVELKLPSGTTDPLDNSTGEHFSKCKSKQIVQQKQSKQSDIAQNKSEHIRETNKSHRKQNLERSSHQTTMNPSLSNLHSPNVRHPPPISQHIAQQHNFNPYQPSMILNHNSHHYRNPSPTNASHMNTHHRPNFNSYQNHTNPYQNYNNMPRFQHTSPQYHPYHRAQTVHHSNTPYGHSYPPSANVPQPYGYPQGGSYPMNSPYPPRAAQSYPAPVPQVSQTTSSVNSSNAQTQSGGLNLFQSISAAVGNKLQN